MSKPHGYLFYDSKTPQTINLNKKVVKKKYSFTSMRSVTLSRSHYINPHET